MLANVDIGGDVTVSRIAKRQMIDTKRERYQTLDALVHLVRTSRTKVRQTSVFESC